MKLLTKHEIESESIDKMTDCEIKCPLEIEFDKLMMLSKQDEEHVESLSIQEVLMSNNTEEIYEAHGDNANPEEAASLQSQQTTEWLSANDTEKLKCDLEQSIIEKDESLLEINKLMTDIINDIINENIVTPSIVETAVAPSIEKIKPSNGSHNLLSRFYRMSLGRKSSKKSQHSDTSESEEEAFNEGDVIGNVKIRATLPLPTSTASIETIELEGTCSATQKKNKKSATMPRDRTQPPRQKQSTCWTSIRKHFSFFGKPKVVKIDETK